MKKLTKPQQTTKLAPVCNIEMSGEKTSYFIQVCLYYKNNFLPQNFQLNFHSHMFDVDKIWRFFSYIAIF